MLEESLGRDLTVFTQHMGVTVYCSVLSNSNVFPAGFSVGLFFYQHELNIIFCGVLRGTSGRPDTTGMDITSRCTLGDPNKLPEGVPQPARMPYISDKHPRQTLEVINLLRKHRELCDVVLVVGAKKIYAHRVILSACSPYFRAMFTGELAESRQTEVVIRDIDERAMELLIDFAYTSQVSSYCGVIILFKCAVNFGRLVSKGCSLLFCASY